MRARADDGFERSCHPLDYPTNFPAYGAGLTSVTTTVPRTAFLSVSAALAVIINTIGLCVIALRLGFDLGEHCGKDYPS